MESADRQDPGSTFLLLVRLCQKECLEIANLPKELGAPNRRLFPIGRSPAREQAWCELLRVSALELARADGSDLSADPLDARRFMVGDLRYCPLCLESGWHSSLFQHVCVSRCPVHGVPIVRGCRWCKQPIEVTPLGATRNHLYCASCGRAAGSLAAVDPQVQICFGALRVAFAKDFVHANLALFPRRWGGAAEPARVINQLTMHAHSAVARKTFTSRPIERELIVSPLQCRTGYADDFEIVRAFDGVAQRPRDAVAFRAIVQALVEIAASMARLGCPVPLQPMSVTELRSGEVMQGAIALPVAALWWAAQILAVPTNLLDARSYDRVEVSWWKWRHAYSASLWGLDEDILGAVTRALTLAVYVECVLMLRGVVSVVEVHWDRCPDSRHVMPSWRIDAQGDTRLLTLRSRATEKLVFGLIRRYARKHLSSKTWPSREPPTAARMRLSTDAMFEPT